MVYGEWGSRGPALESRRPDHCLSTSGCLYTWQLLLWSLYPNIKHKLTDSGDALTRRLCYYSHTTTLIQVWANATTRGGVV
jgi:hypothetical protein